MTSNQRPMEFNDRTRISLDSFTTAVSELDELHRMAHEDNLKGKPTELADAANCPFCSITCTIAADEKLQLATANLMAEVALTVDDIEKLITVSPNGVRQLSIMLFARAYAIGMKCGRNDAIAEFTGVK